MSEVFFLLVRTAYSLQLTVALPYLLILLLSEVVRRRAGEDARTQVQD